MSLLVFLFMAAFLATLPEEDLKSESKIAFSMLPDSSNFIGGFKVEYKEVPGMVHSPLPPKTEMWENDIQYYFFFPKKIYPEDGEVLTLYYREGYSWNWEKNNKGEIYVIFTKDI